MSDFPNFKRVYEIANEILVSSKCIDDFPYSIKRLAMEQADVQVMSYKKAIEKYNLPVNSFGSASAHIEEYMGGHIIFFNSNEAIYRVRFSIGHELGHMILGHKTNLRESDPLYKIQETEANSFSAQLIMPEQIIREYSRRYYTISAEYIMQSFGVSEIAAQIRKNTLAKTYIEWKSRSEKKLR